MATLGDLRISDGRDGAFEIPSLGWLDDLLILSLSWGMQHLLKVLIVYPPR